MSPRDATTLELPCPPRFPWPFFVRYLAARVTPGVDAVVDGRYARAISLDDAEGALEVEHDAAGRRLLVTVRGPARRRADAVAARLEGLFDLAADLRAVRRVLLADPRLAPCVRAAPGLRVPGAWSAFEALARAIVGQQVSGKAASTILGRIAERCGRPRGAGRLFPTPRALADADLRAIGMPGKRAAALQGVARAIAEGAIPFSDAGEPLAGVREALLAQPGIGPWTVEYFALRALRDRDAWPGTDLVLRRALEAGPPTSPDAWRPWRAYAAVHLWDEAARQARPTVRARARRGPGHRRASS